jgi:hypothetical protein
MADQLGSGAVAGVSAEGGQLSHVAAGGPATVMHHGRPVSWVAVSMIMLAFLIGGLALILGPVWWLFWGSAGLAVIGGLLALVTNIFDDWY